VRGVTEMPGLLDAVVIGAGFAGIAMVHKLRELGFSVHGFEAGDGPGGTWYWNRYPGARCDSEAMYYSFSFLPEVEQEWPLLERYPAQPVILEYLEHVTDRLGLREHFTFSARVEGISYDDGARLWRLRTDTGVEATARFVVAAVGCLSVANVPDFPGADSFAGTSMHTGAWPHAPVDFSGQRVGVVGTGASGIQAIPVIAAQARHLTVFQRTAQFTVPANNGPLDPSFVALWKRNYPEWRRRGRESMGGFPYATSDLSALEVSPDQRTAVFEAGWRSGGVNFGLGTFNDLLASEEANATAVEFVHGKIDEIVHDPCVASALKPTGFPFGTKRLPFDTGYYQTFNRPNVTLVDLRRTPITAIDEAGIRTSAAHHDLDVIVYATGFDAMTGPLLSLGLTGRGGVSLADAWAQGPVSYLGLGVPRFPNLFTMTGPGSPSVLSNMPVSIEQHAEWIARCLAYLRLRGVNSVEATGESAAAWTKHVADVAQLTLYPKAESWFMGANIPGKTRMFLPYAGGVGSYRAKCDRVAARGYPGFTLLG
jgi:cation diffusion facilitator CzcD-associated flavoprotein CzcO